MEMVLEIDIAVQGPVFGYGCKGCRPGGLELGEEGGGFERRPPGPVSHLDLALCWLS